MDWVSRMGSGEHEADERDDWQLVRDALDVLNAVMAANRKRLPFRQLLELSEEYLADQVIGIRIRPTASGGRPGPRFEVCFRRGRFEDPVEREAASDGDWSVSRSYLVDLNRNAAVYIEQPSRIDWTWLCGRIGLEGSGNGGEPT